MTIYEHHGSKQGFTLIETLCVLTIVTTLLILTASYGRCQLDKLHEHLFITSYFRQLKLIQLRSMAGPATSLVYHQHCYETTASPFPRAKLALPRNFIYGTPSNVWYYSGHTKARTICFSTRNKEYLFKFQIGKGQIHYEEKELYHD